MPSKFGYFHLNFPYLSYHTQIDSSVVFNDWVIRRDLVAKFANIVIISRIVIIDWIPIVD